ncbi:agmatinase [Candidatus Heimdallarchaeota archaeon B3_Heim]|nr:MAG: agmatinase [Candidatus Heimdallarchaeota archaeon B3_Heim]
MSDFFSLTTNINKEARDLLVLGISWDKSSSYRFGAIQGPNYIRNATSSKIYNTFTETGIELSQRWKINDLGNIDTKDKNFSEIISSISDQIEKHRTEEPIMFLGGDHLITYLCLHAINPKNTGIIYFDAHPDLYDTYEGSKYSHACVLRRVLEYTEIKSQNIVQVGIRAATKEQIDFANEKGILIVTRKEVLRLGIENLEKKIKERTGHLDQIYLSIDLDVLDPAYAPGVGNPEPAGLSTSNVVDLIHELAGLPIKFFDIVEINPKHDKSGITGYAAAKIIKEIFGIVS